MSFTSTTAEQFRADQLHTATDGTKGTPRAGADSPPTRPESDQQEGFPDSETEDQVASDGPISHAADITFRALVDAANKGDPDALKRLREVLDCNPQIWQRIGDLAAHARLTLVRLIANGDKLLFESIQRQARDMESQLLGTSPSLLERLSVQRVVACWLQLQYADAMVCTANDQLAQAKFWSVHQDRAHRRYTSAIKQLTAVRQLLLGSAQGEQAKAAKAATAELCEKQVESSDGCRGGKTDSNGKPKATDGNGVKVEPSRSPGETNKPGEPDSVNGQPVNRILRFPDAPLTAAK